VLVAAVCHSIFGKPVAAVKAEQVAAVTFSLSHLINFKLDSALATELLELSSLLVSQASELIRGHPITRMKLPLIRTWVPTKVVSVSPVSVEVRVSDIEYRVRSIILDGPFSGQMLERVFSKGSLLFLSPRLGFGKKPRKFDSDKLPKHPLFADASQLISMQWFCLLEPGQDLPLYYFELACSSAMMNYNRQLLRSRSNGGTEVSRSRALVQPAKRPRVSNGANLTGSFLQHGGRAVEDKPRLCETGSPAQHH